MNQLDQEQITHLILQGEKARTYAYAPYSGYLVGAALLAADGQIYTGCNIENASYGATNCAERTAFFNGVSKGASKFLAIAILGGKENGSLDYAFPCGVCRQVMQEFCDQDFVVIIAKNKEDYKICSLAELLPYGFSGDVVLNK
ncbi:cytidine deaminase [Lachnospiraceae bacterium OttesenSCG-928-D06]|nr:cytidine deaminase [Lachnospiraceae bacterium OttesenSCG-928-D06]